MRVSKKYLNGLTARILSISDLSIYMKGLINKFSSDYIALKAILGLAHNRIKQDSVFLR